MKARRWKHAATPPELLHVESLDIRISTLLNRVSDLRKQRRPVVNRIACRAAYQDTIKSRRREGRESNG